MFFRLHRLIYCCVLFAAHPDSALGAESDTPSCGTELATYKNVPARFNGEFHGTATSCVEDRGTYGLQYQCVEYVRRFYGEALKVDSADWPGMNAIDFFSRAGELELVSLKNGETKSSPSPGDILVFSSDKSTYGHVAIVTQVGEKNIDLIEQNWSKTSTAQLSLTVTEGAYTIADRGSYKILGWLRRPSVAFTPKAGNFAEYLDVTITASAVEGAFIRYTTDGSTPTRTAGTMYTGPVHLTATTTLKAIVYKNGVTDSAVVTATFTKTAPDTVATPTFSPSSTNFITSIDVTVATTTPGATIRYTTDGSTPTSSEGTVYAGPVRLTSTTNLNAVAYKTGMTNSTIATATFTKNVPATVAAPTFDPNGGTFINSADVTITTTTPGGAIRYTTDGSTPTSSSGTVHNTGQLVHLTATTTLKAVAYKVGMTDSTVASATFTKNAQPPAGMVFIPAGEFQMGDTFSEGGTSEQPVHSVYVDGFLLDLTEVTNQQYASALNWAYAQGELIYVNTGILPEIGAVYSYFGLNLYCDTHNSNALSQITWNGNTFGAVSGKENHPMVQVTWRGAVAYANWRSIMEGRPPCYDPSTWDCNWGGGYRLPTEAEWEKAARGGAAGRRFSWSDTDTIQHARANYRSSASYSFDTSPTRGYHPTFNTGTEPYTSPVGYFAANGYGLYDMIGNVSEWCNDIWDPSYYSASPYSDPHGPTEGEDRVYRGGAWWLDASSQRCADRVWGDTYSTRGDGLGFRLALSSPPVAENLTIQSGDSLHGVAGRWGRPSWPLPSPDPSPPRRAGDR